MNPLELLGQCRDSNSVQQKINGKFVDIIFAGEMTWGDSPSGTGYHIIELFVRLGFTDQFYKAINWGK